MTLKLTDRAKKHIETESAASPEMVPILAWATGAAARSEIMREGWWLLFCPPDRRPIQWNVDVEGLVLSVHPDMQRRLEGKILDVNFGYLQEL
jgi:hypothetical protein